MSLKWKNRTGVYAGSRADCGIFNITTDWDNDAQWTYTIEAHVWTVREFGDYIRSFGTEEKAKLAAEKWLRNQVESMNRALGGKGK